MADKIIGIMGAGMVGGALSRYLIEEKKKAHVLYDPPKGLGSGEEINRADIVFICVPTPYSPEKGGFDLSYVDEALAVLEAGKTIVIKSTILPGTTEMYQTKYPQHKFLFNPEFLTEATADFDTRHPNRQFIGYTTQSRDVAEEVLGILPVAKFSKIIPAKESEMVKYFNNCFYALKVSYANQVYDLCQALGIDYNTVSECAVTGEPMMGANHWNVFHKNYRGYGGKCLPKDVRSVIQIGNQQGVDMSILKKIEEYNTRLNESQKV